jgi:hypothetical protein
MVRLYSQNSHDMAGWWELEHLQAEPLSPDPGRHLANVDQLASFHLVNGIQPGDSGTTG